ncbi:MAG: hypothetical protein JF607_10135 [Burkholderiales bacterium]|nr:hypothetical protein [Burkholderiales bacterium]
MAANLAIHRLSARTPARAQPVAARLALQALGADLEDALPRGLPPQALLWLRRMQLQAPEAALLRPAPPAWRQDWIAAGRQQFDTALAQAARPALGPVPESAPAVLFADAAEMLACLALAAQAGQLDRWWWRGLLGRAWPQWPRAWGQRPEAQAGAQRLLAKVGQGGVLPSADEAVPAAPRGFGVPPQRLDAEPTREVAARSDAKAGLVSTSDERVVTARVSRTEAVELAGAVATASAMKPDLSVLAAPSMPDHAEAQQPVERPVARRVSAPRVLDSGPAEHPAPATLSEAMPRPVAKLEGVAPPRLLSPKPAPVERAREPRLPSSAATPRRAVVDIPAPATLPHASPPQFMPATGQAVGAEAEAPVPASPTRRPPLSRRTRPAVPRPPVAEPVLPTSPTLHTAAAPESAWPWPQALATHQAPLLFIVNALLEDGLYPDFTRPRDPGLPVPLWALLAALSQAWRLPPDALQGTLAERMPDWIAPDALPAAPGAAAGPWSTWLPAYARSLRRRLCQRLGLRSAQWPRALMLAQPARLWLSEAEWVAEFDLSSHDVAWRLAGLDRDPGWLPSAGISLRFRFV